MELTKVQTSYSESTGSKNVLNVLYRENNESYKKLNLFLTKYKLQKESNVKSNITSPYGRYFIPTNSIDQFYTLLSSCSIDNNLVLHYREIQANDYKNKIGSGLMYDFDLFQSEDKNILDDRIFINIIRLIFKSIVKFIDIEIGFVSHVAIITKKKLIYNEDRKLFKNGFHILIPGIQLTKFSKRLIYNDLLADDEFKSYFETNLKNPLSVETFDKGSYSVPVYFLYNCKENANEPYELRTIFSYTVEKNYTDIAHIGTKPDNEFSSYNMIKEFSLNTPSSVVVKRYFELKPEYMANLENELIANTTFELENDEIESVFETNKLDSDEDLEYYRTLVIDVLNESRANNRNSWRDVIFAIANIKPNAPSKFKAIAEMFSRRCREKWDKNEFEKVWYDAITYKGRDRLSLPSLIRWAIEDNKDKFNEISNLSIINIIKHDVFTSENKILDGGLHHYQFARYIHHMFKQKFVYDKSGKFGKWFEFVIETDAKVLGEIYKWREDDMPENLYNYLSINLPNIINKVIVDAQERIKRSPENTELEEYILKRISKLKSSTKKLYSSEFKNGVIVEAKYLFRRRGFIQNLDSDPNIMGVGNGVLELSENPHLIQRYHDYPIRNFTEIEYEKYDKNNPNIQLVLDGIYNLFPDDEKDAFHYIMYYLASCLDGYPKDSMMLILTGNGCHAIDTDILMFDNSIKKVQDINIGDEVMGDDYTIRKVECLYRGIDEMVKITSDTNESFVVNINHILSLKSIIDNSVIDMKVSDYLNLSYQEQSNLNLYKTNTVHTFKVEKYKKDNFYGFELDENHRYLTADGFIHHNSNGKSFLAELVKCLLGNYGKKVPLALLTDSRSKASGPNPALMALLGLRLAYYSESEKDETLNTSTIKELTSQETLSGRRLYEDQTQFRPNCHHLLITNYPLSIKTTDHGIWRRILTYSFKIKFSESPNPKNSKYEKLEDTRFCQKYTRSDDVKKAFLSILVEYYRDLHTNHGGSLKNIEKPTMDKETIVYRNNEDVLSRCIDESCIYSPGYDTPFTEMCDRYEAWYQTNIDKIKFPSRSELRSSIFNSRLGNYIKKTDDGHAIADIRLRSIISNHNGSELSENEVYFRDIGTKKKTDNSEITYDVNRFNPLRL